MNHYIYLVQLSNAEFGNLTREAQTTAYNRKEAIEAIRNYCEDMLWSVDSLTLLDCQYIPEPGTVTLSHYRG